MEIETSFNTSIQDFKADFSDFENLKANAGFLREKAIENIDTYFYDWDAYAQNQGFKLRYCVDGSDALAKIEEIILKYEGGKIFYNRENILKEINFFEKFNPSKNDICSITEMEMLQENSILVTGIDFLIAEEGSMSVIEKTNGLGKFLRGSKIQIFIVGLEQIIKNIQELEIFSSILSTYRDGNSVPNFQYIICGKEKDEEIQKFIIILDNKRSDLLNHSIGKKVMACIDCGACEKICPVAINSTDENFGNPKKGAIGLLYNALVSENASHDSLPFASTLCGKCSSICPVGIEIPYLLQKMRVEINDEQTLISKSILDKAHWFTWQKYMIGKSSGSSVASTFKKGMFKSLFGGSWADF